MSDRASPDINYNSIVALGEKLDRPTQTLLALAPANDPFNSGRTARRQHAEWFAELWEQFGFGSGAHLRRVHYRLSGPDNEPYVNTAACWYRLVNASRDARYLGLVPVEHFVDRRNDDAVEHFVDAGCDAALSVSDPDGIFGAIPSGLDVWLPDAPKFEFSQPVIDQSYHVELWAEKTTVNDVLLPLARAYGLNVVTSSGEISVTHCYQFVQRAREIGRPVRVLYISDFDPAGLSIPVACARKVEFFLYRDGLDDLDIQVRPIALTHEHCLEFSLPRTPLKDTEKRAAKFEARYGEGATELDALEALHPGELRRILKQEICRYYDDGLDDRIEEEVQPFREKLVAIRREVLDRHADELRKIERDYDDFVRRLNPELKQIKDRYDDSYQDLRDRFDELQQAIAKELEEEAPDPASVNWPEPEDADEDDDPLYDSRRDYVEQVDRFKKHQGKSTTWKKRCAS
jgi:hypothetical protein